MNFQNIKGEFSFQILLEGVMGHTPSVASPDYLPHYYNIIHLYLYKVQIYVKKPKIHTIFSTATDLMTKVIISNTKANSLN